MNSPDRRSSHPERNASYRRWHAFREKLETSLLQEGLSPLDAHAVATDLADLREYASALVSELNRISNGDSTGMITDWMDEIERNLVRFVPAVERIDVLPRGVRAARNKRVATLAWRLKPVAPRGDFQHIARVVNRCQGYVRQLQASLGAVGLSENRSVQHELETMLTTTRHIERQLEDLVGPRPGGSSTSI